MSGDGSPGFDLAETHISVLFLVGDRVYKLKKPVALDFVDLTTREARRAACETEVEVNSRLSPDVYLGVADVTGPDGDLCDHLVVMRRMPAERRLSTLVAEGADVTDALDRVAEQVASLHGASPDPGPWAQTGGAEALRSLWADGFVALDRLPPGAVDVEAVARNRARVDRYLDGRGPLFDQRVADGRVVRGHGDLRAEDVFVLDDGPRVLDGIDFDEALLWGDGLLDVAFLAMDLLDAGRPDLATRFLDRYRALTGDSWPTSLAHHLIAYRAHVRAKVAAVRAGQGDRSAQALTARMVELTSAQLDAGRVRLVVVGGLPGAGKSVLARALAERSGAVLVRSDEVRAEAVPDAGGDGPAGFGEGRYRPEARDDVYEALFDQARHHLAHGRSVVLDASWAAPAWREGARTVAGETLADLDEVMCTAPADVLADRIEARAARGDDPSEATPEVARAMAREFPAWPSALTVDTTPPPGEVAEAVVAALDL